MDCEINDNDEFMIIDIDSVDGSNQLRLYGIYADGKSVLVNVHGFQSYFFVLPIDEKYQDDNINCDELREFLCGKLKWKCKNAITNIESVEANTINGCHDNKQTFLKIYLACPDFIGLVKKQLMGIGFEIYEANVPYILRFFTDMDLTGCKWCRLNNSTIVNNSTSNCYIELDTHWSSIVPLDINDIAPLKILSFDIECMGKPDKFPIASEDPIIQISNVIQVYGHNEYIERNVFALGTCDLFDDNVKIHSFKTEVELLMGWRNFVIENDPDLFTGYNIVGFDFPYLIERAEALELPLFAYLGRLKNKPCVVTESTFTSRAAGSRVNKDTSMTGRIIFDLLPIMRKEQKLTSYTLNNVSSVFLKNQKEDVHHSMISVLQQGNSSDRSKLAKYCYKDSVLPLELIDKLMLLVNHVEMCRVTRIHLKYLLTRGQSIKVFAQLLFDAKRHGLLIPTIEKNNGSNDDTGYQGATVIQPIPGFYKQTITTLDFSSLYPSIMIAHNLCYTTLISKKQALSMNSEDYTRTEFGCFVKKHVKEGLLPIILKNLLSARKRAKQQMAIETNELKKKVLNGKQLALKISCNSVYGFTGATIGMLPCLAISASTTAIGRKMIDKTKNLVEKKFNGKVVYGDTDSVMIDFNTTNIEESIQRGVKASKYITSTFISPINLEYEKVFRPYLLIAKKRYAGVLYEKSTDCGFLKTSGIEIGRRDNCHLLRELMTQTLQKIFVDEDIQSAIINIKTRIGDLLQNRIDLGELIISKSLAKLIYANPQVHVEVTKKMQKRNPANAPQTGDRVPYVMIKQPKGTKSAFSGEDPLYALQNNLPIDYQWYLTNQLSKPLTRLMEHIISESQINDLLHGDHTRIIRSNCSNSNNSNTGLMKFFKKKVMCLNCKMVAVEHNKALCKKCQSLHQTLSHEQHDKVQVLKDKYNDTLNHCRGCQNIDCDAKVTCVSRECPSFYVRYKTMVDLEDAEKILNRYKIA